MEVRELHRMNNIYRQISLKDRGDDLWVFHKTGKTNYNQEMPAKDVIPAQGCITQQVRLFLQRLEKLLLTQHVLSYTCLKPNSQHEKRISNLCPANLD
jgi:hypothetical protein